MEAHERHVAATIGTTFTGIVCCADDIAISGSTRSGDPQCLLSIVELHNRDQHKNSNSESVAISYTNNKKAPVNNASYLINSEPIPVENSAIHLGIFQGNQRNLNKENSLTDAESLKNTLRTVRSRTTCLEWT